MSSVPITSYPVTFQYIYLSQISLLQAAPVQDSGKRWVLPPTATPLFSLSLGCYLGPSRQECTKEAYSGRGPKNVRSQTRNQISMWGKIFVRFATYKYADGQLFYLGLLLHWIPGEVEG